MSNYMTSKQRESDILKTIMDGLSAMKIWHMRCNTGGMFGVHKGKRWAVRFGRKGMADILALKGGKLGVTCWSCQSMNPIREDFRPVWIEVKRPGEKQTADQVNFQYEVEAQGHSYYVVHSWEEVLEVLK